MSRSSEHILAAAVFAAAAMYKLMECIDASTTLGVIASAGAVSVASLLLTCSGTLLTIISRTMRRS